MIKLTDILNEDCWKGYKQIGMKTKNGKEVPNCVPESVVKEESLNEASLTISIANIVSELFPKEFFWVYTPQDKERVKSVISDLVRTLNNFYKKQNIKVRFTDTNFKMKMYSKEIKEGLSSAESIEHMKLLSKAMKTMPGSQKQKEIIKQLNVLRIKGGMKPLKEDLRNWFGKGKTGSKDGGGWDRYNTSGEKVGKCGDAKEGEPYAACLSQEKAKKLGKDGIASFVKRKRAAQTKAGDAKKGGEQKKGQKPTFVKTGA
mgnify:CR=1 FL=1|jgi:hypothetical protein